MMTSNVNTSSETETRVQSEGFYVREDGYWEPENREIPALVSFQPFEAVSPIYCKCLAIADGYAVIDIPEAKSDTNALTDWYPHADEHQSIVPEKLLRPQ